MNYTYIKYLLHKIFTALSDNMLVKAALSAWLFFAGIHIYLYAVGSLVVLDVVTGIYASIRNDKPFTSKYLKKGLLEKVALYLILMLAAFALEKVFKSIYPWDHFFVVFFVTVLITTYETVSVCENILIVNPNLVFLKSLITLSNKLNTSAIKYAEGKIEKLEPPVEKKDEKVD